ncbi:2-dehydro-3-deoxygluconokinase [Paenibacillus sophorae]|uniref:2-dehydro-3-deoxygluconokinase n=1 Tax=Paenibacillus sophorae TaxID=1333845 RepID=A0A1H8IJQ5_9BACL|nr:sugar kinase [Paenibacillus sophorae]QWU15988.1 sugar kinase [Paenibacillus sophorae]SEN68714.1 2-dehydro-3-deoxygluconokinase [Paenibacillus sophorae]
MKACDVVTFGEAMAMFIADRPGELHQIERFTKALAGAETNVSTGLARLGFGMRWISKVGNDAFGKFIIDALRKENVDVDAVFTDERYPTGFQMKSKVVDGDPQVQYFRKGSAASTICPADVDMNYFTTAKHLHLTGIPAAISESARELSFEAIKAMRVAGRSISFDVNLRPKLWSSQAEMIENVNALAVQADWVLPGVGEGKLLTGYSDHRDIAAYYLDRGVKLVAVKLGPEGAYYRTASEEGVVEGFKVQAVDTVGAGDGFAVGVISGLLDGLSVKEAVRRGNAIGALAVTAEGDAEGLPTREQLEAFMNASVITQ